jgi:hypothetical protein
VLALVLLVSLGLGVTSCVAPPAPTPDVEELANAIAAVWATQTAQAVPAAPGVETPETALAVATDGATAAPATGPTVLPAATSTAPASPAVTVTPGPTFTFVPTGTPRPGTVSTPVCEVATDAELALAWRWETLGCPVSAAETIWAAWEPFERGYMFWRNDEDAIYALLFANGADPDQGPVVTGGEAWRWDGGFPDGRGLAPPPGAFEPLRGFGRVWFEFLGGATGQLGWASQPERGICVTLQSFDSGVIFSSDSTVRQCQGDLLNMATEPSFRPVFVSIQDNAWWRRH